MDYGATQEKIAESKTADKGRYDAGWEKIFGDSTPNTTTYHSVDSEVAPVIQNDKTFGKLYTKEDLTPSSTTMQYQGMTKEELDQDYRRDVKELQTVKPEYKLSTVGKIIIAVYTAIMIGMFIIVIMNAQTLRSVTYAVDVKQDRVYVLENEVEDLTQELNKTKSNDEIIRKAIEMGMEY